MTTSSGRKSRTTLPGWLAVLPSARCRQYDVLRFTTDLCIPSTNQAERDLRPAKTQQKISGRLRCEQVTRHRYSIRDCISSAAKQGPERTNRPARRAHRQPSVADSRPAISDSVGIVAAIETPPQRAPVP
jgi:hypothetical protein